MVDRIANLADLHCSKINVINNCIKRTYVARIAITDLGVENGKWKRRIKIFKVFKFFCLKIVVRNCLAKPTNNQKSAISISLNQLSKKKIRDKLPSGLTECPTCNINLDRFSAVSGRNKHLSQCRKNARLGILENEAKGEEKKTKRKEKRFKKRRVWKMSVETFENVLKLSESLKPSILPWTLTAQKRIRCVPTKLKMI